MPDSLLEDLATDVLHLARKAQMPFDVWLKNPRIARACTALATTPETAFLVDGPAPISPIGPTEVWTDGACSGNPGPGGWGWITNEGGNAPSDWGWAANTTNNRMEILAVLEGLQSVETRPITIVTDSQYVINGCTKWWRGWIDRGWINSKGDPVVNRDLWEPLLRLVIDQDVTFRWVKGHAGNALNEAADTLAVQGREHAKRVIRTSA